MITFNKVDHLDHTRTLEKLKTATSLKLNNKIFPINTKTNQNIPTLSKHLATLIPKNPFLYPPKKRSDLPKQVQIAKLVREQVLRRTREEVPHTVKMEVDEIEERDDSLLLISARVWIESESQKAILIGKDGSIVRAVNTTTREKIEASLNRRVHLNLSVHVHHGWRHDKNLLDHLNIK